MLDEILGGIVNYGVGTVTSALTGPPRIKLPVPHSAALGDHDLEAVVRQVSRVMKKEEELAGDHGTPPASTVRRLRSLLMNAAPLADLSPRCYASMVLLTREACRLTRECEDGRSHAAWVHLTEVDSEIKYHLQVAEERMDDNEGGFTPDVQAKCLKCLAEIGETIDGFVDHATSVVNPRVV